MNNDSKPSEELFRIGADEVDTESIVEKIRATVAEKMARGVYRDPVVIRAERTNLAFIGDDDSSFHFYIECLKEATLVDINDYDITEKRRFLPGVLVAFKRVIWKLLRFYTYRLWSQQNQTNALLVAALENTENRYRSRFKEMEERVARLEKDALARKSS